MSSSFAASTCRTTLAPFRQDISPIPWLYVMTRRIKCSKIVGAVGFEPTKPLACKASALPLSYAPLVAAGGPRTWIEVSVPVFAAWPHPAGCLEAGPGLRLAGGTAAVALVGGSAGRAGRAPAQGEADQQAAA